MNGVLHFRFFDFVNHSILRWQELTFLSLAFYGFDVQHFDCISFLGTFSLSSKPVQLLFCTTLHTANFFLVGDNFVLDTNILQPFLNCSFCFSKLSPAWSSCAVVKLHNQFLQPRSQGLFLN